MGMAAEWAGGRAVVGVFADCAVVCHFEDDLSISGPVLDSVARLQSERQSTKSSSRQRTSVKRKERRWGLRMVAVARGSESE